MAFSSWHLSNSCISHSLHTLILLLAPWIQANSHWKVFSWINKLKPFLDAYQAPFKDQYYYWPVVLLMVRVVLYPGVYH